MFIPAVSQSFQFQLSYLYKKKNTADKLKLLYFIYW